jgi:hypothetical protein
LLLLRPHDIFADLPSIDGHARSMLSTNGRIDVAFTANVNSRGFSCLRIPLEYCDVTSTLYLNTLVNWQRS